MKVHEKDLVTFKAVLKEFEKRSTCIRLQVAALIVKDGRIISTGWNGVPPGILHCNEYFSSKEFKEAPLRISQEHQEFAKLHEIHAEQNAIAYAAKNGISTKDTSIIISISPCLSCAKLIIASGIKNVYYVEKYDRSEGEIALTFLEQNWIDCLKID